MQKIDSVSEEPSCIYTYVYLCTSVVGTCMNISLFILHYRPCSNDFFIQLHPHPVCSSSCEYSVKCLETSVPRDHLAVSYTHVCILLRLRLK